MARSVREHFAEHYLKSGSFKMKIASELSKALDAEDPEQAKKSMRNAISALQEWAACDKQMKESCEKADAADDLNKLVPTNVSGIVDPSRAPVSSRLVPRSGQPMPSDMPKVAEGFEHLVRVD